MDVFTRKIAITVISALVVHNSQRILESSEKMLRNGLTLLTPCPISIPPENVRKS